MKSTSILSVCFVVALGVVSFVDAVDVKAGNSRLRFLGTGEKPVTGAKKEKKPKVSGDAKDKVESKGKGSKGSMGGGDGGVTAPAPKAGKMSKGEPKVKVPKQPESDVPSYFESTVPSLAPV
jgi:hypothetical protein